VDLSRSDEGKDRGEPLIPEAEVEFSDRRRLDAAEFLEIDDGRVLEAEDPVQVHAVKGAAERVGLREGPSRRVHVASAREVGGRAPTADAQLGFPVCALSSVHA
jgi:hypothetical protein